MTSRSLTADVTPLWEVPAFRRLWIGSTLSGIGSSMTTFAVTLQVFSLTHSSFAVGTTAIVSALPAIAIDLLGGAVIDGTDRRRLVIVVSLLSMAVSMCLALQGFEASRRVWLLWSLVAGQAALEAISGPARRTFIPVLLRREQIGAGVSLASLSQRGGALLGPLLAGVIAATGGLAACYVVDAASFAAALYGLFRLPDMPPAEVTGRRGLRSIGEGLAYLRRTRLLLGALLADANATLLAMPFALFPAVNAQRFGGSPTTLGLLSAAVAVGGTLGAGLSGPLGRVGAKGRGMLGCTAVWGLALALFGAVGGLTATVACLVVAGVADVGSVMLRATIIGLETPAGLRGRVNAVDFVVGASLPELGNFRAGAVASLTTPGVSAISGGLASVVGTGLLALTLPALTAYRTHAPSHPRVVMTPVADGNT